MVGSRVTVFTAAALAMGNAAEVVTIGSKNYPLCEGTGSVDKECVTKGIYDQAELYEIHMPGSIICDSFLLLPGGNVWSSGLRVFLYLICLLYLFLGIAIIADVFMGAIEKITSATYKKRLADGTVVRYRAWNETVANLTLMALGSSAPEILLSCIETVSGLGKKPQAGLGPSTIVGSAAFNLLGISAVCVVSVSESKTIKNFGVFVLTASASVLAYVLLYVVLLDNLVDLGEALVSFAMFPLMVLAAFMIDRKTAARNRKLEDLEVVSSSGDILAASKQDVRLMAKELHQEQGTMASDHEIAKRLAMSRTPASANMYRINAVRGLAGRRPVMPKLHGGVGGAIAQIDFAMPEYKAPEDCGEIEITLIKTGGDTKVRVIIETQDGSAKAGHKYEALKHFAIDIPACAPHEMKEVHFPITIINTADKEDLLDFTVNIVGVRGHAVEGPTDKAHVQIVDTTEQGKLAFAQPFYNVADYVGKATVTVTRESGSSGTLKCTLSVKDGTAKAGTHYEPFPPKEFIFTAGEMSKTHTVVIKDLDGNGEATNTNFKLELAGQDVDPQHKTATVAIVDGDIDDVVSKVARLMQDNASLFGVATSSYGQQFRDAMTLADDGEASHMDYIMHFLTIGWKVVFATVPPTEIAGGWLAFTVALVYIGGLTAVVGDIATAFGCSMGLNNAITAITFVALGTSLPDTFASKAAAEGEDSADAAVGNVTGSNAVNVFLGLGLPWVIGSVHCIASPDDPACDEGRYVMLAGTLNFSVLVFTACALCCLAVLVLRRKLCGGEIGGPVVARWGTFLLFLSLWFIYVGLSSLYAIGYIDASSMQLL